MADTAKSAYCSFHGVSFLSSLLVPEMPAIAGEKCKTPHPGFELTLYWL
jgi:hypothetical protein